MTWDYGIYLCAHCQSTTNPQATTHPRRRLSMKTRCATQIAANDE